MTKEEIIHRLQYARYRIDNATYAPDVLKAIDIAIEMVGNTDSDTISRQAAIEALRKMQTYKLFSGDDMLLIDQAGAQTELMLLPPAQPESDSGRWERHYSRPGVYADLYWHCSKCGYKTDYQYANVGHRYCPNCGRKMEREVTT